MSTELTLNTELEKIKALPALKESREATISKATATCTAILAKIKAEGRTEALIASATAAVKRLKELGREFEAQRKPATQTLDEIKKPFIAHEKALEELAAPLQAELNADAADKLAKQRAAQEEADKAVRKAQEAVEVKQRTAQAVVDTQAGYIAQRTKEINQIFDAMTVETEAATLDTLQGVKIEALPENFAAPLTPLRFLSPEEAAVISNEVLREKMPFALQAIKDTLKAWMDKTTTELIPAKIKALKEGVDAKKIAEATRRAQDTELAQQMEKQAEQSGEVSGHAQAELFDAVTAVPLVPEVRAKIRCKAEPLNERAYLNIIAFWMREAKETPEQLKKRFSVMFTSVEKAYNSGALQSLEGVEWREEVKAK